MNKKYENPEIVISSVMLSTIMTLSDLELSDYIDEEEAW